MPIGLCMLYHYLSRDYTNHHATPANHMDMHFIRLIPEIMLIVARTAFVEREHPIAVSISAKDQTFHSDVLRIVLWIHVKASGNYDPGFSPIWGTHGYPKYLVLLKMDLAMS